MQVWILKRLRLKPTNNRSQVAWVSKVTLPTYTFACADVLSQLYPLFMGQHAGWLLFVLASDIRIAGVSAKMNAAIYSNRIVCV